MHQPGEASSASRLQIVPALLASLAIVVPVIVMGSIAWANTKFSELHPQAAEASTISGATSNAAIGAIFAIWISIAAALLVFLCWRIIAVYREMIAAASSRDAGRRKTALVLLVLCALALAMCITGMVCLSWFRLDNFHDGHMLGSYLLFIGGSGAILCGGLIELFLRGALSDHLAALSRPNRVLSNVRLYWAFFVAVQAFAFLALYNVKDLAPPVNRHWLMEAYTSLEIFLIFSFFVWLICFTLDFYRYEQKVRQGANRGGRGGTARVQERNRATGLYS